MPLGVITNVMRDGDPADPGNPAPYVLATISGVGTDVRAGYYGNPPPLLTVNEFTDTGGGQWFCEGPKGYDARLVELEEFLTMPDTTPAGTVAVTARSTAPGGWLLCYGQAISRTTYAGLFAAISTTYGIGDGSTTFNVPDLRGRVPVALDNMGGSDAGRLAAANTLGGSGGAETHTLTISEMPAHNHSAVAQANASGFGTGRPGRSNNVGSQSDIVTGNEGGGGAHNNMPPYLLLNWMIKV